MANKEIWSSREVLNEAEAEIALFNSPFKL